MDFLASEKSGCVTGQNIQIDGCQKSVRIFLGFLSILKYLSGDSGERAKNKIRYYYQKIIKDNCVD